MTDTTTGTITKVRRAFHNCQLNGWIVEYDTRYNNFQVFIPGPDEPIIGDAITVTTFPGSTRIETIDRNGIRVRTEAA